jgi:hypothetical protein
MQYKRYADMGLIPVEEVSFPGQKIRLFDKGHNMHDRWAKYFQSIGILKGLWQCTNPFCKLVDEKKDEDITLDQENFEQILNRKFYTVEENEDGTLKEIFNTRVYGLDSINGVLKPEKCVCGGTRFVYHETPVIQEEMNMKGHADLVLDFTALDVDRYKDIRKTFNIDMFPTDKPVVVDMKTINDFGFKKLRSSGPSLAYRVQLTLYANVLDCAYGILIYENKNDSSVLAYRIDRNEDTWWPQMKEQARLLNEMVESKKMPPPRPSHKKSTECKYCDFSSICHSSKIWENKNLAKSRKLFYGDLIED